jgi:lipopolysaccharide heptosyltransferase III
VSCRSPSAVSILVIHPGALGDVLQAVPALRALRRHAVLTFSGQARIGRLLVTMGLVETALPFDGVGFEALFTRGEPPPALVARLAHFDRVVSWFGARDTVYVDQLRAISPGAVIAAPVPEDDRSVWRHLLSTIEGDSPPDLAPIALPDSYGDEARRALDELGVETTRALLVVHPGAGGEWKVWPAERLARAIEIILRRTGARALVHQGPADRHAVDRLCPLLTEPPLRLVEPELPLLASVLGRASAYVGMDSGVSHLAAAVGAPSVILFPSATRQRWTPWSPTATALAMSDDPGLVEQVAATVVARLRAAPPEAGRGPTSGE